MSETLDRLQQLPPDRFAELIEEAIASRLDHAEIRASPPSPAGAIDLTVRQDGDVQLYHARQYETDNVVGAPTVRELVELRDRRNARGATLLTTGDVSTEARDVARRADVTVFAGEDLAAFVEESEVSIPTTSADGPPAAAELAERFASYWPERLRVRADAIVDAIEQFGEFQHRVQRADASTELEFLSADGSRPIAKVRFTETSLLVFVWDGTRFDRVVALTVHRERPPDTDTLLAEIRTALDAVDDSGRS